MLKVICYLIISWFGIGLLSSIITFIWTYFFENEEITLEELGTILLLIVLGYISLIGLICVGIYSIYEKMDWDNIKERVIIKSRKNRNSLKKYNKSINFYKDK